MFLAVVDHGTFTRAAAASYVSQPALSQAIRELERELGTRLFDRVGRGVRLTAAGAALVTPARQTLRDVEAGRAAVAAVAGVEAGQVDAACLPTLAEEPTARVVGDFRRAHPGTVVTLAAPDDPLDLLSMVRSGTVELAVTEDPGRAGSSAGGRAAGLAVHRLADQALVAVFPPGTADLPDGPVALRDFARRPLVVTAPGTSSRRILDEALGQAASPPIVAVETAQREALVPLVLAGAGAALLPAPVAATAARLGAEVRATSAAVIRRVALVHRDAALSPAAVALRDLFLRDD
jgi:LysR family carnitine catabolism transcriptional activator